MSTYQIFYNRFQRDFFACITTGVLVSSIVGSIAAMYVLMHGTGIGQMIQLFFVVSCSMGYNGAVLSQQKPKTIFNILLFSIFVNAVIAVINMMW
jgi:hypothetical protein